MANIENYGYEKIRTFVLSNWKYLQVCKPDGTILKRFSTTDGLTITGTAVNTELEYKVVISGSDATFIGQSVGKSVLFDVATGGSAIATETFTTFTFESVDDSLTILHKLQIPAVI